jgi:hypothetical protein
MQHIPSFAKAEERERSAEAEQVVQLSEGADALDYLRSVYTDPLQSTYVRLKAAIEALPFERPKLAVTAVIDGNDFEGRLKRAIARSGKVIDANAGPPQVEGPAAGSPPPVDIPHPPAVPDRRFRRA